MTNHAATTCTEVPRAEQIARLNDQLRRGDSNSGTVLITQGVQRITGFDAGALAEALANYCDFDPDNDPHGERDFGDLTLFGHNLLFKIDYFDRSMEFGSDDPADEEATCRVLTVLLASEW